MVCFYNFIELYIFIKFYISNDELSLPKYLPYFIKNRLAIIHEVSKSDIKNEFLLMFSRFLFSSLFVTFLTLTISYLFYY